MEGDPRSGDALFEQHEELVAGTDDAVAPPAGPTKLDRRMAGASSWNGFFKEAAIKLAFLAVLLLVVWVVSATR